MSLYVFLDIDGVLNTYKDWHIPYTVNSKNIISFAKAMERFPEARIILTSSWRTGWDKDFSKCTPQIQELINAFKEYGLAIYDVTRVSVSKDRGAEVLHYVKWHNVSEYIVIDDDINEFITALPKIQLVDPETGFVKIDKKKICRNREDSEHYYKTIQYKDKVKKKRYKF